MANPTLLDMPIARDGNKNAIPTTDNGTTGLLSQQYGWQLINAIPPQQGGKAVKREDFNGALYLLSNLLFYLQKGFTFEYDETQDYYKNCIVLDPTNSKMYRAKNDVSASATHPSADNTNWELSDLPTLLANYLPLSGGTMNGEIHRSRKYPYYMRIFGGPEGERCANIQIMGAGFDDTGNSSGRVALQALSDIDDDETTLFVKRNGSVILTTPAYPNGTDLAGSAIVAKSIGTESSYVKTASGELRQWFYKEVPANTTSLTVTFPITFPNWYTVICTMGGESSNVGTTYVSNSQFTANFSSYIGTRHLNIIAIGY